METSVKTDYVGTGCLYQDVTGQVISIYDPTEVDQNLWDGIDLSHAGGRDYSEDFVSLWTVNKRDTEAEGRHPLKPKADGKLPVVNI